MPIRDQLAALLNDIAKAAVAACADASCYGPDAPRLSLLSQLASGVDQMAAEAAKANGYALRAVLPFDRGEFAGDFDKAGRERFEALLAQTEACWSLPGRREQEGLAYALAGEATAAQCDILIAVWDGAPARGLGGTADVIDYAVQRGAPVIHLGLKGEAILLWSALDDLPPSLFHRENVPRRRLDPQLIEGLIRRLLLPAREQPLLDAYYAERERHWRFRLEYPLLLSAAGIRRLSRANLRSEPYQGRVNTEWTADGQTGLDRLERAYAWADGLADHFAQNYRSGMVFNFAAAAGAVLLVLIGFVVPEAKVGLIIGELALIAGLIVNTRFGRRHEWHRRWLDYRYLAEQLRAMRSLKLFSIASPRFVPGNGAGDEQRWIHWYAAALWRELGTPSSLPTEAALAELGGLCADREIETQVRYHRLNAHRMHQLDHRLHRVGGLLFATTAAVVVILLAGYLFDIALIHNQAKLLSVLAAALPTLGSAVFGIRGAGDFAGAAARSARTAARLEQIVERLRSPPLTLSDAARSVEEAAASMLRDLGEWRNAYQMRDLAIPA